MSGGGGGNPIHNLFKGLSEVMTESQMSNVADKNEWWQSFRFPETPDFSVDKLMNCARSALFGAALMGGPTVMEGSWMSASFVPSEQIIARAVGYIAEFDGRLIYNMNPSAGWTKLFFVFSGGAILVKIFACESKVGVELVGTTKAHMQLGKDLLDTCIKEDDEQMETK
jgi:hypothetical protein